MTLHVLGAGSIGLLYACSMRVARRKKFPVCLLLQPHHESKMRPAFNRPADGGQLCDEDAIKGSNRKEGFVSVEMKDFCGKTSMQDIPSEIICTREENCKQDIRNILLVTKAPHAVQAIESVIPRFRLHHTDKINLVIMTNGSMSVYDGVHKSLKQEGVRENVNLLYASTTHGAIRGDHKNDFSVTWTGVGETFLIDNDEKENSLSRELNDTWNEVGLRSSLLSPDQMYILNWKKLATNCAINPLTAIKHCQNGDLLQKGIAVPSYEDTFNYSALAYDDPILFYQLIREVSDLARAEAEICSDAVVDIPLVRNELTYEKLTSFVENVVYQTSRNKSSMLQDIIAKRFPTEIVQLNGYVSMLGDRHDGLEVGANKYIVEEIKRLTNNY